MVVTRKYQRVILTFFIALIQMQGAFAEMMAKGRTRVKTVFNLYHQNSNDGAQVYDNSGREEVNVIEPMLFIEHQINEDTAIDAHFVFDFWTAASDTKIDGMTGASGEGIKSQSRTSGNLGLRQEKGSLSYGVKGGFSSEYDYKSLNISADITRSFAKDNFTLGLGLQYYSDKVSLFKDLSSPSSAKIAPDLPRKIMAASVSAGQILTVRDIIQFELTFVKAKDNLESTASSVLLDGVRSVEILPGERERYAISSKWVHGLNDHSAINLSYRFYNDSWDLQANTVRAAYLLEVNDDEDFIEFHARYHAQDKVKYFKKSFSSSNSDQFRTSDSDMDKFKSWEGGIYYSAGLDDFEVYGVSFENLKFNNGIVYSTRNNGLRYGYYQGAISLEF